MENHSDIRPNGFENSVALICSLHGLHTLSYSEISELKDAPDGVSISNDGDVFVIECTNTHPGKDNKLLKLFKRATLLREFAKQKSLAIKSIIPVLATSLPRSETKSDWPQAAELGVSLICREEINWLIGKLDLPPNSQDFAKLAARCIPQKDEDEQTKFEF